MHRPHDLQGQSRVYHLLSRLYLDGLTATLLADVAKIPGLASGIPDPYDEETAAADYQHLFGFNIYPYASVFLSPDGLLGGPVSDQVRRFFQRAGCALDLTRESADHVGQELAFLAFLLRTEAEMSNGAEAPEVSRLRRLQRRFMDHHLLGWLPVFVRALGRQGHPFYARLATFTLDVVLAHRARLGNTPEEEPGIFALSVPPALLEDENTDLNDVAAFLTTPPWSGLFLSRDDIRRLGRAGNLPHGFGDRARMLAQVLRAAATYDGLEALLDRLAVHTTDWRTYFDDLGTRPGLGPIARVWQTRLDATERLCARVRTAADGPNAG